MTAPEPGTPVDPPAPTVAILTMRRSEREMSVNRFAFCAVVILYLLVLGPRSYASALLVMGAYTVLSLVLLLHLLRTRSPSLARCVIAVAADMAAISGDMLLGGAELAAIYSIYLWVILGNGFRFGLRFLFLSAALAVAGFASVCWYSPFWAGQPALAVGLLLGLITVPLYGAMLIRRLSVARLEAENANRAKSMVLASVSHSVRTPLNAIIGGLSLLTATRLDAEQRELAAKLRIGCDVLMLLLGSILDFTRIEAGRMPVRPQPVSIADILQEIGVLFRQQAEEKGLRLFVHVGETVPEAVVTDRHHITEILVNLIGNALKFTEKGEVLISVTAESVADATCRLLLEVSDTGIGISPEVRERIFDSFTQADDSIIDRFGGTGLGLTTVRGLAGMLGGTVTVASVPAQGSRFSVRIDCDRADTASPRQSAPATCFPAGCIHYAPSGAAPDRSRLIEEIGLSVFRTSSRLEMQATLGRVAIGGLLILDLASTDEFEALIPMLDQADPSGRIPRLVIIPGAPPLVEALQRQATTVVTEDPDHARLAKAIHRCAPPPVPEADASVRPSRCLDILVADDNVTNQRLVEKILVNAGHNVRLVNNGEEAVEALVEHRTDLALFDINMPVMNGIEAAKEYRFLALGSEAVPIIALTADATADTARRCREVGIADCIIKPINPGELIRRIDAVIRQDRDTPSAADRPIRSNVAHIRSRQGSRAEADLDPQTLQDLRALGGEGFVHDMVDAFLRDTETLVSQIASAAADRDLLGFRNGMHALRSAAANVGATEIGRLCNLGQNLAASDLPGPGRQLAARVGIVADLIRRNQIGQPDAAGSAASGNSSVSSLRGLA